MNKLITKANKTILSGQDIKNLTLNTVNVVPYHVLMDTKNINELFKLSTGEIARAVVILYEDKKNNGHFTCLIDRRKESGDFEFFDPYGCDHLDEELKFSKYDTLLLKQSHKHKTLSQLINESGYNSFCSHYKFQKDNENINTCGRHCAVRIRLMDLPIKKYSEIIKPETADNVVTMLTILETDF